MAATTKMEYVNLGRSGLKISKVILGCMSYGTSDWQEWVLDEQQALPLLEYAYKRGINTWNTVRALLHLPSSHYKHHSGKAYCSRPGRHLLQRSIRNPHQQSPGQIQNSTQQGCLTECFAGVNDEGRQTQISDSVVNDRPWANRVGLSRKHIFDAVDAGVQRLGSYINVLQIHRLDREPPREENMRALNDVIESGKVRYIGASSNYHNLLAREEEQEMIPYCIDAGIGLIPWSPLARGVLARPWRHTSVRDVTDRAVRSLVRGESDEDQTIVDRVEEVAAKKGVSMAQVATAWSLSHHGMNPILGLNSKERIDEVVTRIQIKLSEAEIEYLEEAYTPKRVSLAHER